MPEDESEEPQPTGAPAAESAAAGTSTEPPKKYPKGVVLGKDGKPCRTCNALASFTAHSSSALKTRQPRKDCPPDVEALGRSSWTLLHSIAATYPPTPTPQEQSDIKGFLRLFSKLYPCWVCAEDFQQYLQTREVKAGSRAELGNWMCDAHNEVNRKLGKPTFDYIREQGLEKPVAVAEYLFKRLHEVSIRSIHGVPGDFNLVALDYIPKAGLKWVGSVNELNAAYAADGYARTGGISAVVTTFGVGELSAINGIAGAFSEHVPVVHIVGCPSTISQRNGMLLHHTLGNGDFNVFANMSSQISCVSARLNKPGEIADQIDHALRECWIRSRPVYIMLPTDMVEKKIEGARLDTPIDLTEPPNEPEREDYVVDVVLRYLHEAKSPVILVDACAVRHRVLQEVQSLVEKTQLPVFVTPMGKGAINENLRTYGGVYAGTGSKPGVAERVESADLVITIGAMKSDFNTAGFSYRTSQLKTIDLHSDHCTVRYSEYPRVAMRGVLQKLVKRVDLSKLNTPSSPEVVNEVAQNRDSSEIITQAFFWPRVGEYLKEDDIVVTETGTSNFGIWETKYPRGVTGVTQILWGSIGWSVGATQGAALAAEDMGTDRRTILFVGDGSFQLTAQEVTTMMRHNLRITIFLIYNEGFTIERYIHGMEAEYNDVVRWNYVDVPTVFGGTDKQVRKFVIKTKDELEKLLTDKEFNEAGGLQFVELWMPKDDAPRALKITAEIAAKNNAKEE
ncbi:thiamine diphosphate-binding protein [Chaetomium sp. MPI-SDFR-AT-0129]|nr:thiamine diphosphate-binding protein [Chaetomium sp. MPI-SDFR-AT-0129]